MDDMPTPPMSPAPPWPAPPQARPAPRGGRVLKLAVGLGAAAGVAVGATALAQAATSSDGVPQGSDATATASAPTSTATAEPSEHPHGYGGMGRFGGGFEGIPGPGGFGIGGGPIYGQFTLKGPNGYETLAERTGTVSDVTDTSGSTWSLTVKSADGTSGTFTVDSGTSVNGGEMGIGSVKTGDTVRVTAVVSGSTSTAKQVTDETALQANGGSWRPTPPSPPGPTGNTGPASEQSVTPPL